MDPLIIEETVREAIRAALSAASSPSIIRGKTLDYDREKKTFVEGQEVEVVYVEKEELRKDAIPTRVYLHGRVIKIGDKKIALYTPPWIPSERELAEFIDAVRKDVNIAKIAASLAMTISAKERGEIV